MPNLIQPMALLLLVLLFRSPWSSWPSCLDVDLGLHHFDAVDNRCRNCGHVHKHCDMLTYLTAKYWPLVPTETASDPFNRVKLVFSQRYLRTVNFLQLNSLRTSTVGIIAAANHAAKIHGRCATIRKQDFYQGLEEFKYFINQDARLLEEDIFSCPCCVEDGCNLTTDGLRKAICYNASCKNCGHCERCLNRES